MSLKLDLVVGDCVTAHCLCGKVVASMTVEEDSIQNDAYDANKLTEGGYYVKVNYPGSCERALTPCEGRQCSLSANWDHVHGKMKLI